MARSSDDGPLLPMHNLPRPESSSSTTRAAPPPPYTPPLNPEFYSRSESPPKPHEMSAAINSGNRNRRNACICMGVGVVLFVAVPAAVFGSIIHQAHTDCVPKAPGYNGGLPDGQKFC